MNGMHIVVFYQYYHNPDCPAAARHYTFVREWSRSHRVTIITGNSWYKRRITEHFDWVPRGVKIKMLDIDYDNSMSTRERFGAFARFAASSVRAGLSVERPDIIFGTSTPLTTAWAASKVAALRRTKWIFEVRDLWPDFPIQMGAISNRRAVRLLRRMEERLYRSAAHVIALSPDMADHVRSCGIDRDRVSTIVNGTDFDLLDSIPESALSGLQQQYDLAGRKVVLYAGMFGRANDIPTLLEAAERVADRDDLRFVLIGSGFMTPEVLRAADQFPNLVVPDPQPRHAILSWFKLADLTLVPFIDLPVLAANSPSKFFDSLGAGTPVIVTNPGWTKEFVERHGCGWYVPPSSPASLVNKISDVLDSPWELARAGVNGRRIALESFNRIEMAARIERIMEDLAK